MAKIWIKYTKQERYDDCIPHAEIGYWVDEPPVGVEITEAEKEAERIAALKCALQAILDRTLALKRYTLAVFGPMSQGKSTLVGQLIYCAGKIRTKTIDTFAAESRTLIGRDTFKYSWVSDQSDVERKSRQTADCHWLGLSIIGDDYLAIMDTPGNPEFIGKTIAGITHADAALLVVSASYGEFESGISQMKEHLNLAAKFGIKTLIVAVTKMDGIASADQKFRFDDIVKTITGSAEKVGFSRVGLLFVPVGGLDNLNILNANDQWSWYRGPSLFTALQSVNVSNVSMEQKLPVISKASQLPGTNGLRFTVLSVTHGAAGTADVVGRVVIGSLQLGAIVQTASGSGDMKVTSISRRMGNGFQDCAAGPLPVATPGDIVTLTLENVPASLASGHVLTDMGPNRARMVSSFVARLTVKAHDNMTTGYEALLNVHGAEVRCRIGRLLNLLNNRTLAIVENAPLGLHTNQIGDVEIIPLEPVCLDTYITHSRMGTVSIRYVPPENPLPLENEDDEPELMRIVATGQVLSVVPQ